MHYEKPRFRTSLLPVSAMSNKGFVDTDDPVGIAKSTEGSSQEEKSM